MAFPVKYIENNLVLNQDGEWYAYYELLPYNYAFLSPDEKLMLSERFRRVVAANRSGKLHALCISSESSVRERQEACKKHVSGKLKELAFQVIDVETENLIGTMQGVENEVTYRFFLGFKLVRRQEEISFRRIKETAVMAVSDFISDVNHNLMGDFVSVSDLEIERYAGMEKLLYDRIKKNFRFRRLEKKDFGYIIEHVYGQQKTQYYTYSYDFPTERVGKKMLIRKYDILRLTRCLLEEHQKHIRIVREEGDSYVAYLTVNALIGELTFPSSEIFYYQQEQSGFEFPVDVSMNVEIVPNVNALTTVRNKKKELKDLDEHAYTSGNDTEDSVIDALESVDELEQDLGRTKESMYKLSYVVRVAAETRELLERRVVMVRDYYEHSFNMKLVRPFGDMVGLHEEFVPAGKRYRNDYIQYVKADFLSSLGYGASRILGDEDGTFIGYDRETGKNVYIDPPLAAQGVSGSVTNSLAMSFTGTLGGGKSMLANNIVYHEALYGAKILIIDPKSERGNWKNDLWELADEIQIVSLTNSEEDRGTLDPYVIMKNKRDAETLALDILTYLTGTSIMDGRKFSLLRKAVRGVSERKDSGLLYVVEELRAIGGEEAELLAEHIASFADYDFAGLLFSDGHAKQQIDMEKQINIIQVQNLILPDREKEPSSYTSMECLSVAMMIVISTFALKFIYSDRNIYKVVLLDEAWSFLRVPQGKALGNQLARAGRSMQAGVYFVTQSCADLSDDMKNNIGLKFAFRSTDITEIKNILKYFGLDPEDEGNQEKVRDLVNGECLTMDLRGRVGKMKGQILQPHVYDAFDTRPVMQKEVAQ